MDKRISKILSDYKDTVKPLLFDIQCRRNNGQLPNNFLNEIRALNDHIARCYRSDITQNEIDAELTKAEGHLRRLVYDCFKQLNIYISDVLVYHEEKYYSDLWLTHDSGNFWDKYSKFRKYAQQSVIEAKKAESINPDKAMKSYENAFINYREAENLLLNNKRMLRKSRFNKYWLKTRNFGCWLLLTIILSIISAIIGWFV